jgi:sporulation protein YlmC with PRC-barrel domain
MRLRHWLYAAIAAGTLAPAAWAGEPVGDALGTERGAGQEHAMLIERQEHDQFMADRLIGSRVHNLQDEEIGAVSDLLIDRDGRLAGVVVGGGGVLGVGQRDVALRWDAIEMATADDGEPQVRVDVERDVLERSPEVEYRDDTAGVWGERRGEWTAERERARVTGAAVVIERQEQDHYSIERLLGSTIRTVDGEEIGEVSEVLLDHDGRIAGVVVGVGGFLGIGEHDVALRWDAIELTTDDDGEPIAQVDIERDALERAPAFEYRDEGDAVGTWGQRREVREEHDEPARPVAVHVVARQEQDQYLAERLIGRPVHNLQGEELGEISDLLIGRDGEVAGIVVGVGGFLGIGRRDVGLSWDALDLTTDEDGDVVVQADVDRATLRAAPRLEMRD